jgi:hypothetical protein
MMRTTTRLKLWHVITLIAVLSLLAACGHGPAAGNAQAATPDQPATTADAAPFSKPEGGGLFSPSKVVPSTLTVPAGTPLTVRLQASLSSASAEAGQEFDAVLEEPVVVNGQTVAARGTPVIGRVVVARHSGRLHNSGYIRVALSSVEIGGKQIPVQTSSVFAAGGSHKNRNLAWIGGSTAGGAIIGALAGGGKGAAIGSMIGAGGGTTAAYATGEKNVGFAAERTLSFRLTQPLTVRG